MVSVSLGLISGIRTSRRIQVLPPPLPWSLHLPRERNLTNHQYHMRTNKSRDVGNHESTTRGLRMPVARSVHSGAGRGGGPMCKISSSRFEEELAFFSKTSLSGAASVPSCRSALRYLCCMYYLLQFASRREYVSLCSYKCFYVIRCVTTYNYL